MHKLTWKENLQVLIVGALLAFSVYVWSVKEDDNNRLEWRPSTSTLPKGTPSPF